MIRITTAERIQIASPDQIWSLIPGFNHFEFDMPDAVASRLAELQLDGSITVDIIDGDGHVTPWQSSLMRLIQ